MKDIPIKAAKRIADDYGYDQVVIIARRVGIKGGEHVTTYGRNKEHCSVAARIGDFLKFKVMMWLKEPPIEVPKPEGVRYEVQVRYRSTDGTDKVVSFEEWQRATDIGEIQLRHEENVVLRYDR